MDEKGWSPERLRALDVAVAEARGYTVAFDMPDGDDGPKYPWIYMGGDKETLPEVSLGCRGTFELLEEARIEIHEGIEGWSGMRWDTEGNLVTQADAPTIPISICLAYLAARGVPFNG